MSEEIIDAKSESKNNGKRVSSTQPLDPTFAKWLERLFRDGEKAQYIDAYPLYKGRDREQRLYHHSIKDSEPVHTTVWAVDTTNEIFSDCQVQCDRLPRTALSKEGTKSYEIAVIDESRGGLAKPVGTFYLKLEPRVHQPAPDPDDDDDDLSSEDGDALTARKMILEVHRENNGRQERQHSGALAVVGETMLLLKESLKDAFVQNRELHGDIRGMMGEFREMIKMEGQRRVEEKAVMIDAENAAVEREFRRASMAKENMWTDVMRATMMETVKLLGGLFPGFGHMFAAIISGKPIPPPPQLPTNGTNGTPPPAGQPQLPPGAPGEKALVDRFIETAEKHKVDEQYTAAEKLFGKDDDAGKNLEPGVFTREQVAILTGVHMGSLGIDALDALLPDSGKPEAIQVIQMAKAIAYLTPDMTADITQVMNLRKAARK